MGFLGLEDRYKTVWYGGRSVMVYPDGTVIDYDSGEFVRLPENTDIDSFNKPAVLPQPINIVNELHKPIVSNEMIILAAIFLASVWVLKSLNRGVS